MRRTRAGWVGVLRLLLLTVSVVLLSCGGGDLTHGQATRSQGAQTSNDAATTDFVAGVKLAIVSLTPTHSVELWETEPGTVLIIQKWDAQHGDDPIALGPRFRKEGGTFGGLYRGLLNDPNAVLSPELVAADARRSKSPIRDASIPRPPSVPPPFPAATLGKMDDTPAPAAAAPSAPGTLVPLGLVHKGGGTAPFVDSSFCDDDPEVDAGWCPPGAYYGFVYGNAQEVMFLDSVGHNPQASGGGKDQFTLNRIWSNGSSYTPFSYGLAPGHSVEAVYIGTAATFQAEITGDTVSYAEKWRLSFPSLQAAYSAPDWGWNDGSFANDIEGIAHGSTSLSARTSPPVWFFSRTQFDSGRSVHGQIGINTTFGGPSDACTFDEPLAWHGDSSDCPFQIFPVDDSAPPCYPVGPNYAHYGDIAYEDKQLPGLLIVSLNDPDNQHAAVGFLAVQPSSGGGCAYSAQQGVGGFTLQDRGTVELSPSEQAPCVAVTHKYQNSYVDGVYEGPDVTHIYVPGSSSWNYLHEYMIDVSSTPSIVWQADIPIVNANLVLTQDTADVGGGGPNGMKVSAHGKLYMWTVATEGQVGRLLGIDSFSGMIQIQYDYPYTNPGAFLPYTPKMESEGLDIINEEFSPTQATRATPEIVVQILANSPVPTLFGNSQWQGLHLSVDDPARL